MQILGGAALNGVNGDNADNTFAYLADGGVSHSAPGSCPNEHVAGPEGNAAS